MLQYRVRDMDGPNVVVKKKTGQRTRRRQQATAFKRTLAPETPAHHKLQHHSGGNKVTAAPVGSCRPSGGGRPPPCRRRSRRRGPTPCSLGKTRRSASSVAVTSMLIPSDSCMRDLSCGGRLRCHRWHHRPVRRSARSQRSRRGPGRATRPRWSVSNARRAPHPAPWLLAPSRTSAQAPPRPSHQVPTALPPSADCPRALIPPPSPLSALP